MKAFVLLTFVLLLPAAAHAADCASLYEKKIAALEKTAKRSAGVDDPLALDQIAESVARLGELKRALLVLQEARTIGDSDATTTLASIQPRENGLPPSYPDLIVWVYRYTLEDANRKLAAYGDRPSTFTLADFKAALVQLEEAGRFCTGGRPEGLSELQRHLSAVIVASEHDYRQRY